MLKALAAAAIAGAQSAVSDAYEEAQRPGGRHHGFLDNLPKQGDRQIRKTITSQLKQAERHESKIAAPQRYVPDWNRLDEMYRAGLLEKWRKEAEDRRQQAEIARRYLDEKG